MPEFTITREIGAPVEKVWEVLNDFGEIQRWSPGVTGSELTSDGPVSEGSTRHCDFAPFGGVNERIDAYTPNERNAPKIRIKSNKMRAHNKNFQGMSFLPRDL